MDVASSISVMTPTASQVRCHLPALAKPRRPGRRTRAPKSTPSPTFRPRRTAVLIASARTSRAHARAVFSPVRGARGAAVLCNLQNALRRLQNAGAGARYSLVDAEARRAALAAGSAGPGYSISKV